MTSAVLFDDPEDLAVEAVAGHHGRRMDRCGPGLIERLEAREDHLALEDRFASAVAEVSGA